MVKMAEKVVLIFNSFDNDKDKVPAKIIFKKIPIKKEPYLITVKNKKNAIISRDYNFKQFFEECVDGFQDFEYDHSKITTVNDFWQILPIAAAEAIAAEAYFL